MSGQGVVDSRNGLTVFYDKGLPGQHHVYHGFFNNEHVCVKQLMPKMSEIALVKSKLKKLINVGYHPNIAEFKKVSNIERPPCILVALEPCRHDSLRSLIRENRTINQQDHKVIFRHMLEGLKFLHDNGILHRNISPHLVIFSKCGKMAKLCGLANINVLTEKARDLSGTTQFTSPEYTKQPPEPLTEKSDVYSAAMVMLFTATNGESVPRKRRAFGGSNALGDEEEQTDTSSVESNWFQRLESEYPNRKSFIYLLKQMLATEPVERPTVHEILLSSYFWDDNKIESCDSQVLRAFKDDEDISNEYARGNFERFYWQTPIGLDETNRGFIDLKQFSSDKERCMLMHDLYLYFGNRFIDAPDGLVPALRSVRQIDCDKGSLSIRPFVVYDDVVREMENLRVQTGTMAPKLLKYSDGKLQDEEFIIDCRCNTQQRIVPQAQQHTEPLLFQGIHQGYIPEEVIFKFIPFLYKETAKIVWKMQGNKSLLNLKRNVIVDVRLADNEENILCQPGKYVCIAMEKCPLTLTAHWQIGGVSFDEIQAKLRSLLKALEFIHSKGIVHNAIAVQKLLLTEAKELKICPSRKSRRGDDGSSDMADLKEMLANEIQNYIQPSSTETSEKVLFANLCQHVDSYSATRALYHPFLWTAEKKFLFLKLAGDEFDHRESNDANVKLKAELKDAFTTNWANQMHLSQDERRKWFAVPNTLEDREDITDLLYSKSVQPKNPHAGNTKSDSRNVKKYNPTNGIELLRFIRNVYVHWEDDISKMKRDHELGDQSLFLCEQSVWNFFSWRFPKLLFILYQFILIEPLVEDVRKGLEKKGFFPRVEINEA